jgi:arylformamidase
VERFMSWVDISTPLVNGMTGFPGDPVFRLRRVRRIEAGDPYNLSSLSLGSHAGTHVDPPRHFFAEGGGVDAVPLERLNGPCHVLQVPRSAEAIGAREIRGAPSGTKRLLLRTRNSERWEKGERFFSDYTALRPDAAEEVVRRGIELVGIDSLSIESDSTGTFPVHHRLLGAGVLIVEGLRLAAVPPGEAELRCMPLRIQGGDGGPCRAAIFLP